MPRKIIVFSSKTNTQRTLNIENFPLIGSINTWGDLKNSGKINDLISGDMIATQVQTKTTLSNNDSVLAFDTNETVHIVITPAKVKSGSDEGDFLTSLLIEVEALRERINKKLSENVSQNDIAIEEMKKLSEELQNN